jgi:hypothetical protein
MSPKVGKGKAVKSTEAERLAQMWKKHAVFPPTLDAVTLRNRY